MSNVTPTKPTTNDALIHKVRLGLMAFWFVLSAVRYLTGSITFDHLMVLMLAALAVFVIQSVRTARKRHLMS